MPEEKKEDIREVLVKGAIALLERDIFEIISLLESGEITEAKHIAERINLDRIPSLKGFLHKFYGFDWSVRTKCSFCGKNEWVICNKDRTACICVNCLERLYTELKNNAPE